MPTVLQIFKPSGTLIHFSTQQPSVLRTLPLLEYQARSLLVFLVVEQLIILVAVH